MIDCTTVETLLSGFERADLSPGDSELVAAHLSACPACRVTLGHFEALSALTKAEAGSSMASAADASAAGAFEPAPGLGPPTSVVRARQILAAVKAEVAAEAALATVEHEIMTFDEVAAYLRLSPDELEAELASLPYFEIGGRIRVRRGLLMVWIEEREGRARNRRMLTLARG